MSRELTTQPLTKHIVHVIPVKPVTILLKAYTRSLTAPPAQNVVENAAAQGLLSLPHLDEGGDWDVSSVMIPSQENIMDLLKLAHKAKDRLDEVFALVAGDTEEAVREARGALFILTESMKEIIGLEEP